MTIAGDEHVLTTVRDVTGQKRAEAALQQHVEEQAATLEELRAIEGELRATEERLLKQNEELKQAEKDLRRESRRLHLLQDVTLAAAAALDLPPSATPCCRRCAGTGT